MNLADKKEILKNFFPNKYNIICALILFFIVFNSEYFFSPNFTATDIALYHIGQLALVLFGYIFGSILSLIIWLVKGIISKKVN